MARIKKGDVVAVLNGKDKGKTGKVLRVWPEADRALVERLNLVKHFERRSQQNQAGGVIAREGAIPLSRLALVCPRCKKPGRVGWSVNADRKVRVCKRCNETVS